MSLDGTVCIVSIADFFFSFTSTKPFCVSQSPFFSEGKCMLKMGIHVLRHSDGNDGCSGIMWAIKCMKTTCQLPRAVPMVTGRFLKVLGLPFIWLGIRVGFLSAAQLETFLSLCLSSAPCVCVFVCIYMLHPIYGFKIRETALKPCDQLWQGRCYRACWNNTGRMQVLTTLHFKPVRASSKLWRHKRPARY